MKGGAGAQCIRAGVSTSPLQGRALISTFVCSLQDQSEDIGCILITFLKQAEDRENKNKNPPPFQSKPSAPKHSLPKTHFCFPVGTAAGEGEGSRRKSPPSCEKGAHHPHVCVLSPALAQFLGHHPVSHGSTGPCAC